VRRSVLLLAALALGGCETTAEKSAQLEREAKRFAVKSQGISIAKPSAFVKVLSAQVVHGSQSTAAVVTLRNTGPSAVRDVPIEITVRGSRGNVLFQNNTAGLEAALTSVALLKPGAQTIWIDDQVQTAEAPSGVTAEVGEGAGAPSHVPQLLVDSIAPAEGAGGVPAATGTVHNESTVAQRNLVIYAVALRGGKIVGAGRALLPELASHGSSKVEVYFAGQIKGAQIQMSAAPTSF
jgi:hypothetical protein